MYDQETSEFVKLILAGCAALIVIAMAIVAHFSTHPSYRRAMRYIRVALLVTVVAGCGNYYCLSLERFLTRVNGYDMVHSGTTSRIGSTPGTVVPRSSRKPTRSAVSMKS